MGVSRSSQSKVSELRESSNPQLSELPPSISAVVIEASPFASRATVISWQRAFGRMLSSIVTVKRQVITFPLRSY